MTVRRGQPDIYSQIPPDTIFTRQQTLPHIAVDIADAVATHKAEANPHPADTSLANGEYWGITRQIVAGENLVAGDVAYLKTADAKWWKTDADIESTVKPQLVLCVESITANATGTALKWGYLCLTAWDWIVGLPLFIDKTTAGGMTQDITGYVAGDFVRCLGQADDDADTAFFGPSNDWYEI